MANSKHAIPSANELRKRHEAIYVEIFTLALSVLAKIPCDTRHENIISERLCIPLNDVCFELSKTRNYEIATPIWESPIQPIDYSELKEGKPGKRPDFTCKRVNPFANSSFEHEFHFHVECKRLGTPSSPTWRLNEQYVINGIMRFDSVEHRYGELACSGLMVGYIIDMSADDILTEVKMFLNENSVDRAKLEPQSTESHIQKYIQRLNRKFVKPLDFKLTHLWVDIHKLSEK